MCCYVLIIQSGYLFLKLLTGTYEGRYTYVFEMCCYRTLDIVTYIVANYKMYISFKALQTLKKLCSNVVLGK